MSDSLMPSQTVGPFVSIGLLGTTFGNNLVAEDDPRAIRISGRLIDGAGDPVVDGMIEVWQPNHGGRFAHPADGRSEIALEEGFSGFGRSGTANAGRFEFITVKPGRVPWPDGRMQAPHILIGVFARGLLKRAATRLYFADEEAANAEDPVLRGLDSDRRRSLIAQPESDGYRFDIVLQGVAATAFFAL
jgi:protocatechuate 3,4-dioxygenase, alpha subunit